MTATKYHETASVPSRHPIHAISEFASTATRNAHIYDSGDIGKVVSTDTGSSRKYWIVINVSAGVATFREVGTISEAQFYNGWSTSSITWASTTWAGIHNAATLVDGAQVGVTRSNSTFTVTEAGVYVIDFRAFANNTTGSDYIMVRARKSGVTVAAFEQFASSASSANPMLSLLSVLALAAGDAITLEYAVTPTTFTSATASVVDGETARTVNLSIYRIGA